MMRCPFSDFDIYKLPLLHRGPWEVDNFVLAGSACRKARVSLAELTIYEDLDDAANQRPVPLEGEPALKLQDTAKAVGLYRLRDLVREVRRRGAGPR